MNGWEVTSCPSEDKAQQEELEREGWEPFAAMNGNIWWRRWKPRETMRFKETPAERVLG